MTVGGNHSSYLRALPNEALHDLVQRLEQQVSNMSAYGTTIGKRLHAEYQGKLDEVRAELQRRQVSRFAIMSPGAWVAYQNLVTGIASDKTPLARPRAIENMEFLVTSNIAGDATSSPIVLTTVYLGDFRDLTVGIRREASIDQLRLTTYASNLLLEFVGYLRADYVARRPASFHTIEGVAA